MTRPFAPYALLVLLGAGWGMTQPLSKIAVSTGYHPLGLLFWQLVVASLVLGALVAVTGRRLPRGRRQWAMCLLIALIGSVLPNTFSYLSIRHLPAGVTSIVLSMVPMLAFPVALFLGNDRFSAARLAGLALGLLGVALIALPRSSLPGSGQALWILVALVAPTFYAFEGNIVARWGTAGLDPVQLLFGASLVGLVFALPAALLSGEFIAPRPGRAEAALVLLSAISALVYATYVWLIGRTGPVFAAQTSYLVTAFGVVWAMLMLGERYSGWVWTAFVVMLLGLALVRPRAEEALPGPAAGPAAGGLADGAAGGLPEAEPCANAEIGHTPAGTL
ncbi:DMT family transporter [Acidimangrovimonas sediminis]|uniref:DMT family transporter n=1 Tax=Acidimangrovimonas sediminis TaxID=2056283 RepID=UPI0018EC9BE3|nr:DMT family transporter [Acidimangrovimonas sediminis]